MSHISYHKVIKIYLKYLDCFPPIILLVVTIMPHYSRKWKPYTLNLKWIHSLLITFCSSNSTDIWFKELICVPLSLSSYTHIYMHSQRYIHIYGQISMYTHIYIHTSTQSNFVSFSHCSDPLKQPSPSHLPLQAHFTLSSTLAALLCKHKTSFSWE